MKIEKAEKTGFCFGVRRAMEIIEKAAREHGGIETLGQLVHNRQVLQKLADIGVKVVEAAEDIQGDTVAISAHGISPELEAELQKQHIGLVDTTCPYVHRAQQVARRLNEAGFFVVVYGEADHPEVKGILGWTKGKGVATLSENPVASLDPLPRWIGVLSQTTRIPAHYTEFIKTLIDAAFTKDSEIRIFDTICHDIRDRQEAALKSARTVDLMFVVGGRNSANTNHLARLCSEITETRLIETAEEIKPEWLKGHQRIGVTGGASTDEQTINEVIAKLEALT
ncbi:MAG: 4-hydroxy-3-methylbut-2-enyl diphosphate reductase [Chloroflexi bacterium]|nr:4-hydroxy-3-methylbut-2-enyl diphosphate reductase [Chloroflexota bacterium]